MQLASQEKLRLAEINNANQVELEKMRHVRETRRARNTFIGNILVGIAILAVVLAFIGSLYFGINRSEERRHDLATQCVTSGGRWIDGNGRDGDRCDRP